MPVWYLKIIWVLKITGRMVKSKRMLVFVCLFVCDWANGTDRIVLYCGSVSQVYFFFFSFPSKHVWACKRCVATKNRRIAKSLLFHFIQSSEWILAQKLIFCALSANFKWSIFRFSEWWNICIICRDNCSTLIDIYHEPRFQLMGYDGIYSAHWNTMRLCGCKNASVLEISIIRSTHTKKW